MIAEHARQDAGKLVAQSRSDAVEEVNLKRMFPLRL
jgi:hypothetical protein